MKKVLIITYYWPPGGGSGVRRWLNFSNLFHDQGWQPVIFRPLNASYPSVDETLGKTIHPQTEIIGSTIFEPFKLYSKFIGAKGKAGNPGVLFTSDKPGLKEKLSVWVRSNVFIPDARMFWIRPAVKALKSYLQNNHVDLIISTGPPHTTHMIAMKVAGKFSIPWIADFRDPWTKIDFFHKLSLSKFALNKHLNLEKKVLTKSQLQTTVSWSWAADFKALGATNIKVVTNGFDSTNACSSPDELDNHFTITHLGSMNDDRNHPEFWKAIRELMNENPEFAKSVKIKLFGEIVSSVKTEIAKNELEAVCEHVAFIPHPDAMKAIATSRVLYLPLNNTPNVDGIIPGKIFEYLAAARPILAIGPETGDSAKILSLANNGIICNFGDFESIKLALISLFSDYQNSNDRVNNSSIEQFSRAELAKQMVGYMNELVAD